MRIFIVRHASKEFGDYYNDKLKHQDSPLSDEGVEKAKRLVDYFKYEKVDKIIASEYLRAFQTAKYVAENEGLEIIRDKRLNEIDNGIIESLSDEEIIEKYPDFWNDFFTYAKDVRFPEGETGEEVKKRQDELLEELKKDNKNVLLVSHEGYIRLLMCNLLQLPVYKRHLFKVEMCGIMEFEFDKKLNSWRVIRFNQSLDI
ncbi:histidine phosphatase family protein [Clostridium paridis]|uniref:Histidine phosphatase family protein n=1 Tax=Clostridium paridis TaxID=2803863 RepID=A0A937FE84_9CLOT|nr:histidine phosphatase family protein [Clostridium paridis]MBL4931699.1 histidine phosphatase family protein [Clostridium paridis]